MTLTTRDVKRQVLGLGADLCGIASADRFAGAPAGYHPREVLPECRSVVVFARRFLVSTQSSTSSIPYTVVRNGLTAQMDRWSVELAYWLEAHGSQAIPTGVIGPTNFDDENGRFRGLISLKHAAMLAGLGTLGKNTLLINNRLGNMIWLGAVLTSARLEPDPLATYEGCPAGCRICIDACPIGALDGPLMDQARCWDYAFGPEGHGEWRIKCFACRLSCPHALGMPKAREKAALAVTC